MPSKRIRILAYLNLSYGILLVVIGLVLAFALGSAPTVSEGEKTVVRIDAALFFPIAGVALATPSLLAWIGLLKSKPWGRWCATAVAVVALFNFPLGTAFAFFSFSALFGKGSRPASR